MPLCLGVPTLSLVKVSVDCASRNKNLVSKWPFGPRNSFSCFPKTNFPDFEIRGVIQYLGENISNG